MQTKEIQPLICSASPRDLPDFSEAISTIPCDRLFAKYYTEAEAYKLLRSVFLFNKIYTHMIICPDDLIVTAKDYDILVKDIENHDYPIIGGTCNLFYNDPRFITCSKLDPLTRYPPEKLFKGKKIKQVAYDGFAFTFIRRDVVKQIGLRGDEYKGRFDYQFAIDCRDNNIPIHVDVRAKMLHLANRLGNGDFENIGIGKEPRIRYEQYFS